LAIDTGTSWTVVAQGRTHRAGIKRVLVGGSARDGRGAAFAIGFGVTPEIRLGELRFGRYPVAVVDDQVLWLRDPIEGGGERIDGLLGFDLLQSVRVEFRVQPRELWLGPATSAVEGARGLRDAGRLLAPVRIEDHELWFLVDTGATHTSLSPAGLAQLRRGAQRSEPTLRRHHAPGGSGVAVREIAVTALHVGGWRFGDLVLPIVERSATGVVPMHGVLGADLLLRHRLVLDSGALWILPD
jgi:predicted aspartyl protease